MFAVVEDFEGVGADNNEFAATCLTHTERKEIAQRILNESKQLGFDLRIERYAYRLLEFNEECPNCGRNFEF